MFFLQSFPLSRIESLIFIATVAVSAVIALFAWLWYVDLDRQTHAYDNRVKSQIQDQSAFSGIQDVAHYEFIATSNTLLSKSWGRAKKIVGERSQKPHKIIPVDDDVIQPRKIEFIRERVQLIPGRNILGEDLTGALRNYYAYKLALSTEEINSAVVEHFKTNLREYDASQKVSDLAQYDAYDEVTLIDHDSSNSDKDPLNDVFLPLVKAAEDHCVGSASDVDSREAQIEQCRQVLKLSLYLLWTRHMKGIEIHEALEEDECVTKYRTDLRDEDNWGYWMLPSAACDEDEFERLRHVAWSIENVVGEYWEEESFSKLHPQGDSIQEMEFVETPFAIFHRNEQEIRGGAQGGSN